MHGPVSMEVQDPDRKGLVCLRTQVTEERWLGLVSYHKELGFFFLSIVQRISGRRVIEYF